MNLLTHNPMKQFFSDALALTLAAGSFLAAMSPAGAAAAPELERKPVRVLVVTGGHDYETSFYTVFEGQEGFVWSHAVSNGEAFREDIRDRYDVLVLYDMSQDLDANGKANLRAFVEGGKGLVLLHHAIADYNDWPWWYEEVVGGRYLLEDDGDTPASTYRHDEPIHAWPTGSHPVTEGIEPFDVVDETYGGMWISPEAQVLLETDNPTGDAPIAWVSAYPKSRVVYVQLGHGSAAHRHPAYRKLVGNAILWAAGRTP